MSQSPHIIFFLADDIGWSDLGFNNPASPIPTPNIDALANKGVKLKNLYTYSLCTPSRASLLTGLYHINTELTFVLTPGTPAGLPDDIPTLPEVLREKGNYNTAMVGKWHLGHSQRKMTPTGRGFNSFTGMYMWDCDYHTKQMSEVPWRKPMMIDWVQEYVNGTYQHYAEPAHSTIAIAMESEKVIRTHAATTQHTHQPLFLYVPFTAAHSPLQPLPEHEAKCAHIPHLWRRQFCGLVVGVDEAVKNITSVAQKELGENLLIVFTSDNGGSPWFGGLNYPLRGTKGTPFEGGVKVPGLITDFTPDQRYLSNSALLASNNTGMMLSPIATTERVFNGMMHFSDWLPTLLSYAHIPHTAFPTRLDGFDLSPTLKQFPAIHAAPPSNGHGNEHGNTNGVSLSPTIVQDSPRTEILLEYMDPEFSVYNESSIAYRYGKYKFISGTIRDDNYYSEPTSDRLHFTRGQEWMSLLAQQVIRLADWVFGTGPNDNTRVILVHLLLQNYWRSQKTKSLKTPSVMHLYDLETDPFETTNLLQLSDTDTDTKQAQEWSAIVQIIQDKVEHIRQSKRPIQKVYLQYHLQHDWPRTFVPGNCSANPAIRSRECLFTHPWIPDNVDPWVNMTQLINSNDFVHEQVHVAVTAIVAAIVVIVLLCGKLLAFLCRKGTQPSPELIGGKKKSE